MKGCDKSHTPGSFICTYLCIYPTRAPIRESRRYQLSQLNANRPTWLVSDLGLFLPFTDPCFLVAAILARHPAKSTYSALYQDSCTND